MMSLQSDVPAAPLCITAVECAHDRAVQPRADGAPSRLDLERVPLADRARCLGKRRRQTVDRSGSMPIATGDAPLRINAAVIDLHLVPLAHRWPPVSVRIIIAEGRNANEHARVVLRRRQTPVDDQDEVRQLEAGIPEDPWAARFDSRWSVANVLTA
jgi:hypothetical protein